MSHETVNKEDEILASLLLMDAPAARDPLFRLRVLERRERQRYRRRVARQLAAVLACFVYFWIVATMQAGLFNALFALVVATGLIGAYFLSARALAQMFRDLAASRPIAKNN